MASASFPAWATSLPKRDLTSTIAPGKEWDKPDFPAGPPSAILIATGWNNDIMNPSEDSLTRSSLAFNIWARVDTSQPGNHLFFCVTRIRTTCSFSLPTAQPTGPVARIGTWDWYSETTFQLAWNDLKDHVLPCREYRISNAARGAHRCFNANTSIINHPNRMVIVRVTRWTPSFAGIRTCWQEKSHDEQDWARWQAACADEDEPESI